MKPIVTDPATARCDFDIPIPNNPNLVGPDFFVQALVEGPGSILHFSNVVGDRIAN